MHSDERKRGFSIVESHFAIFSQQHHRRAVEDRREELVRKTVHIV